MAAYKKIITTLPSEPSVTTPSRDNLDGVYSHPKDGVSIKGNTLPNIDLGRDSFMGTQASGPKKIVTTLPNA